MTEDKNKNLDETLSKFFSPDLTEQAKKDFAAADTLFEQYPAPVPSYQTIAEIKQKIAHKLENKPQFNWSMILLKTAAVAAIIVIAAVILTDFSRNIPTQSAQNEQQASPWQKTDASISFFEMEIAQLKNELAAINFGEDNGTNGILTDRVEQIELETIETENTFWKG